MIYSSNSQRTGCLFLTGLAVTGLSMGIDEVLKNWTIKVMDRKINK